MPTSTKSFRTLNRSSELRRRLVMSVGFPFWGAVAAGLRPYSLHTIERRRGRPFHRRVPVSGILEFLEPTMELQDDVFRFAVSGLGMVQRHQPDRFVGVGVRFRRV